MTYEEYERGSKEYVRFMALSQWQRWKRYRALRLAKEWPDYPVVVFDPWRRWRWGFDSHQMGEWFGVGPFAIEWTWE